MKAPRIVQSYWSKAYQNTPNSGWAFRESHYMSWELSCLQLKQFYDEIELVTDSEGADQMTVKGDQSVTMTIAANSARVWKLAVAEPRKKKGSSDISSDAAVV